MRYLKYYFRILSQVCERQQRPAAVDLAGHDRDLPADHRTFAPLVCVLDAHAAALPPNRVVAFVAAIRVRDDGMWKLDLEHGAVRSTRQAVRERVALIRRQGSQRPDPAVIAAMRRRGEMERQANAVGGLL